MTSSAPEYEKAAPVLRGGLSHFHIRGHPACLRRIILPPHLPCIPAYLPCISVRFPHIPFCNPRGGYSISRRFFNACVMVSSSTYSNSSPNPIPRAMDVIFSPSKRFNRFIR